MEPTIFFKRGVSGYEEETAPLHSTGIYAVSERGADTAVTSTGTRIPIR